MRKKLRDLLNRVFLRTTLRNINILFNYVKHFTKIDKSCKVKVSYKEEQIQLKRQAWKKAQAEAERLLNEYKAEKGNFYKN